MQSSLEIRPPFLDNDMINLAFKIEGTKIKYSNQKVILKKAMKKNTWGMSIFIGKKGFCNSSRRYVLKKKYKIRAKNY